MKKFIMGTVAALSILTFAAEADASRSNPIFATQNNPYGTIDFSKVTPADYEEAVLDGIATQARLIKEITDNPAAPTFENTIVALDRSSRKLGIAILALSNNEHATGDSALMDLMAKLSPKLAEQEANIILNEALWKRIKAVYDTRSSRTDLTPEDLRLLTETYDSFANNGANLKGADREKYRKLTAELSELTTKFSQNVTNHMQDPEMRMFVTEAQTAGIPESIKNAARAEAAEALKAEGKADDPNLYLFTIYAPSYGPFMKYAKDRSMREKLYRIYGKRNNGGKYDNRPVLKDIANVRMEIAQLLGNKNHAESTLKHTMAGSPEGVYELLYQLKDAYTEPMHKELAEIESYARETEGPDFKLMPWDYSYWSDQLKQARYSFNDEDMKPYFEIKNTIDGVFGLATRLYGYKFKPNKNIAVYHPDVTAYEVYGPDGKILGILYTDFYYRPGKAPGAWMTEYRAEIKDDNGNREVPLIAIVMNFSKPVGNEPVLLTPYEVETFLHEFGHSLHGLSSEAKYESLSGTNVYHDFVELPSQFNENYLTQSEFLDTFAKHYKTGKKMPKELVDKFVKASQYGAAYACMRQLGFGFLDMAYYTRTEPFRNSEDVEAFEVAAIEPVRIFEPIEGAAMSPSFGHIFSGGYSAGYYGYKWAEMLDADAFEAFVENGLFDKKTANKFRKILQSGGTVDPMELYVEFRGKKPTIDAMLKRDGIQREQPSQSDLKVVSPKKSEKK